MIKMGVLFVAAANAMAFSVLANGQDTTIVVENATLKPIHKVQIAARDPGIVEVLDVKPGEMIEQGTLVVGLDRAMYEAELERAKLEWAIAQKESANNVDLKLANKTAAVNQTMLARFQNAAKSYDKSVSRTDIDRLQLEVDRAALSADQAQLVMETNQLTEELRAQQVAVAKTRLRYREIRSPIRGIVQRLFKQKGEWALAGEPVASVVAIDKLRVECFVASRHAFTVRPGQQAAFQVQVGEQTIVAQGQVVFVNPEVDPIHEEIEVWAEIQSSGERLKPGLTGTLQILVD